MHMPHQPNQVEPGKRPTAPSMAFRMKYGCEWLAWHATTWPRSKYSNPQFPILPKRRNGPQSTIVENTLSSTKCFNQPRFPVEFPTKTFVQ